MKELFADYTTSKELEQLGFNEPCLATIDNYEAFHIKGKRKPPQACVASIDEIKCPLKSQIFDWFREKYDLMGKIEWNKHYPNHPYQWNFRPIWREQVLVPYGHSGMSKTYQEAESDLIKEMLNYIKNNK